MFICVICGRSWCPWRLGGELKASVAVDLTVPFPGAAQPLAPGGGGFKQACYGRRLESTLFESVEENRQFLPGWFLPFGRHMHEDDAALEFWKLNQAFHDSPGALVER